jgi:hypothetical protein
MVECFTIGQDATTKYASPGVYIANIAPPQTAWRPEMPTVESILERHAGDLDTPENRARVQHEIDQLRHLYDTYDIQPGRNGFDFEVTMRDAHIPTLEGEALWSAVDTVALPSDASNEDLGPDNMRRVR